MRLIYRLYFICRFSLHDCTCLWGIFFSYRCMWVDQSSMQELLLVLHWEDFNATCSSCRLLVLFLSTDLHCRGVFGHAGHFDPWDWILRADPEGAKRFTLSLNRVLLKLVHVWDSGLQSSSWGQALMLWGDWREKFTVRSNVMLTLTVKFELDWILWQHVFLIV